MRIFPHRYCRSDSTKVKAHADPPDPPIATLLNRPTVQTPLGSSEYTWSSASHRLCASQPHSPAGSMHHHHVLTAQMLPGLAYLGRHLSGDRRRRLALDDTFNNFYVMMGMLLCRVADLAVTRRVIGNGYNDPSEVHADRGTVPSTSRSYL